jgi:signal transduction histidine kinase
MKKRIIIGLACFTGVFFLGGLYIIVSIEKATSTVNTLIRLHGVELMREQLLSDTKRVQSDLVFRGTHYATQLDTLVANAVKTRAEAGKCVRCHHSPEIADLIIELRNLMGRYNASLSRVLTLRASPERMREEEHATFQMGQDLIERLNTMTVMTKTKLERRTEATLNSIEQMKIVLFALIILGPFLALGLAVTFITGFTKPVNALLFATRKLKGGDLTFRVEGLRNEFGELAASFNEMAASLNEQMQNLQRAEQLKVVGEMAAGIVHEIKNPLAGIKATMQVLLQESACTEDEKTVLSKVMDEAKRIEGLMKSLLDFARPAKPHLIRTDVNTILDSTLAFAAPYFSISAASRPIEIIRDMDPLLPAILVDPTQMHQVFMNLTMNAVEAMPQGGTLKVGTRTGTLAGTVEIDIADSGKGIDEHVREQLFRPFFTTKHKGTGLGLAITQRLVEMHGGTISVTANGESGTVFTIALPAAGGEEG